MADELTPEDKDDERDEDENELAFRIVRDATEPSDDEEDEEDGGPA